MTQVSEKYVSFKRGNLTQFLADVFTLNAHPNGQTLRMTGLPTNSRRQLVGAHQVEISGRSLMPLVKT